MVLHMGVLGSNHRNVKKKKNIKNSSSSELFGLDARNSVCSSPLPSLFRWRSWDPTWPQAVGA